MIADQGIEPTINLAGARRIYWRSESGRDLVTFTRYPETVEDLVRDAVRVAGLPVDEETVTRTLGQLFELSGEAKHQASVGDLLAEFDKFRGSGGLSDRTLLG